MGLAADDPSGTDGLKLRIQRRMERTGEGGGRADQQHERSLG